MITLRKKILFDEIDVTKNITELDIYQEVGKLISSLHVVAKNTKKPENIKVYLKRDNKESVFEFFPTEIKKDKSTLNIEAKTKMVKYSEELGSKEAISLFGTAREVLMTLTQGLNTDFTNFKDYNLKDGGYFSETYKANAIMEILKATDSDVYLKNQTLFFSPKIYIDKDTTITFDESDILNFSVNEVSASVKSVTYNVVEDKIYSAPSMLLTVTPSPQPLSPDKVELITDDNSSEQMPRQPQNHNIICPMIYPFPNYCKDWFEKPLPPTGNLVSRNDNPVYKLMPTPSLARMFFNPLVAKPTIKGFSFKKKTNYTAVETFELKNEISLSLSGGIKSINAIAVNGKKTTSYTYKKNHNIIIFNSPVIGEVQVSYKTHIYEAIFPTSKNQFKIYNIKATMLNQTLVYKHTYKATDYFPLPYFVDINFITDWAIDPNEAVNKDVYILKVISANQDNALTHAKSNLFGELSLKLTDYGIYKLQTRGYEPLFITFFINQLTISLTPVYPAGYNTQKSEDSQPTNEYPSIRSALSIGKID